MDPQYGSIAFDPGIAGYLADPHPTLRALREQAPCWVDPGTGKWFLLSRPLVEAGLSQIVRGHPEGVDRHQHFPANPFAADGPGHVEPRRLIVPRFTNRAVQQWRDRSQQIVDEVLDSKAPGDPLTVVDELAFRLPYALTCEILGVPELDDPSDLRDWTWRSLELIDAFLGPDELRNDLEASAALADHLREVLEWKREHMADDLFSQIIASGDAGEVLRPEQVLSYVHTLYLAGMHTTVNQVPLSLWTLLSHRDQWDLLCERPELLGNAVEELLRFEPTAHYFRRTAEVDVEIEGLTVPAGTDVLCWIASANRDAQWWGDDVDQLDITRPDASKHLTFGFGPHVCIGSWLARLELQVVLGSLVDRFPGTMLADLELVWSSNVIRGPEELVLELAR